jgi:hypothetical protein
MAEQNRKKLTTSKA